MGGVAYDYSMIQDFDSNESAATKAGEILKELRAAISLGGFDDQRMLRLAIKWIELGMLAKGSGYLNTMAGAFRLHFTTRFGRKTSQELLDRVVRLYNALAKHLDIKERFLAFNAAEDAMRALMDEYRTKLNQKDHRQFLNFDGQLRASLAALNPDFYKTRGD